MTQKLLPLTYELTYEDLDLELWKKLSRDLKKLILSYVVNRYDWTYTVLVHRVNLKPVCKSCGIPIKSAPCWVKKIGDCCADCYHEIPFLIKWKTNPDPNKPKWHHKYIDYTKHRDVVREQRRLKQLQLQ